VLAREGRAQGLEGGRGRGGDVEAISSHDVEGINIVGGDVEIVNTFGRDVETINTFDRDVEGFRTFGHDVETINEETTSASAVVGHIVRNLFGADGAHRVGSAVDGYAEA
jgi:hypothetical protein